MDAPPRREYVANKVSRVEGRWRRRGHQHPTEHMMLLRTPGAADTPPPIGERPLDAPPSREYVDKQVSRLESHWRPRGRQRHHMHLTPMRTQGAVNGPPPSRERPLDAPPLRKYFTKQVFRLEGRWRPRGLQRRHKHLMPLRTQGAANGPPPIRELPLDAPPRWEYITKQVSRL